MPSVAARLLKLCHRAAAIALVAMAVLCVPRQLEAQGQCWQFQVCTVTPPTVGISIPTAATQAIVTMTIYLADADKINVHSAKLWKNGVDVTSWYSTASSPFDPYQAFSTEYTGLFPLDLGSNTIIAEVCELYSSSVCGRDTVVVYREAPPTPPQTAAPVLTLAQRVDARDLDAGAASYDYATVPYFSMDSPRGVALHYSSGTARPDAEIQIDAVVRSAQIPSAVSVQVRNSAHGIVFPEQFFVGDTGTFRLAARFSATCPGVDFCSQTYRVFVRVYYGNASTFTIDSLANVRVLVHDASTSRFGSGWTIAYAERLRQEAGGAVLSNGAGQLEYFTKTSCTGSDSTEACDYTSPIGDESLLRKNAAHASGHPNAGTRYFRAYKNGDTTFFNAEGLIARSRTRFASGQVRFGWTLDSFGARLDSVADPMGRVTRLTYEPASGSSYKNGSLTLITLPDSRATDIRVSSALGDLTQILGPDGLTDLTATYDGSSHRLIAHAERVGGGSIAYDTQDRVSKLVGIAVPLEGGGSGADSAVVQAVVSRALSGSGASYGSGITRPLGADSAFTRSISSNGDEVSVWAHHLGSPAKIRSRAANGDTTVAYTSYYINGRTRSSVITGQSPTTYEYSINSVAVTNTASGDVTIYETGAYDQLSRIYFNSVLQTQYFYSGSNLAPDSVRSDTANTTRFRYDSYGRIVSVRDARQAVDSTAYDATSGNTLLQRSTAPGVSDRTTTVAYDGSGRAVQITDHLGRVATTTYDALNRTLSTLTLGADASSWTYNDASRTYTFTDPNNNTYTTQLNAAGWTTSETDPYGYVTSYGYNRRGGVVRLTDRRGVVARWYKDALDRDTLQVAGSDSTRFAYDLNKRWFAVRNSESTDTLYVNASGLPTTSVSVRGSERYITTRGWIAGLQDGVTFEGKSGSSTLWTRSIGALYDAARRE